jgi:hypothetical protein
MSADIMKALRFAEFGPPSVLRIEEVASRLPQSFEPPLTRVRRDSVAFSEVGSPEVLRNPLVSSRCLWAYSGRFISLIYLSFLVYNTDSDSVSLTCSWLL